MHWLKNPLTAPSAPIACTALFANLTRRELRIVQGFMHPRQYLPGEIVFDEGEEGQALYIVMSGKVRICLPGRTDATLAELGSGDFFGEMGLLDQWPRAAQAISVEHTEVAALFRGDFERLMSAHAGIASKIAVQLARHIAARMRELLARQGRPSGAEAP